MWQTRGDVAIPSSPIPSDRPKPTTAWQRFNAASTEDDCHVRCYGNGKVDHEGKSQDDGDKLDSDLEQRCTPRREQSVKCPHDPAGWGGGEEGGSHWRRSEGADSTLPGGQTWPEPEQARAPARLAMALKESPGRDGNLSVRTASRGPSYLLAITFQRDVPSASGRCSRRCNSSRAPRLSRPAGPLVPHSCHNE
jgi:hypothetical protein